MTQDSIKVCGNDPYENFCTNQFALKRMISGLVCEQIRLGNDGNTVFCVFTDDMNKCFLHAIKSISGSL